MKKQKTKLLLLGVSCMALIGNTNGQSTTNSNNFFIPAGPKYLGYFNNGASPLLFKSNNIDRMQLNGNLTVPTTAAVGTQNTSGFLGINTNNPWSRVHIAAPGASLYGGYRGWMREGLTLQESNDQLWFGHKKWGANPDQYNAIINWGDDQGVNFNGPDHLVFNFTSSTFSGGFPAPGVTPNAQTDAGVDIMRLTDLGLIGIGPRFSNQFTPQSTLHQHQENSSPSWMQITNQASPIAGNPLTNVTAPTPITANDGLRWGIDGANTGFFYNQENNHLLFSTNRSVIPGLGTTNERMRISQIGAPGIPNPGSVFPNDITRVSISHNPNAPVTRPLSLLHLGYNTQGATNDGWRPWMDVGMYVSQSSDNVFLGLKNESLTPLGDQLDAVLSWGDNQVNSGLPPFNGPDKFRFIFTSSQAPSSPGSTQAKSANGLEALRMNPTLTNGVFTGIGGDPSGNLYSGGVPNPNNTLEVNSWGATTAIGGSSGLRFTNLTVASPTIANPGQGVLSVNANVIYVQGSTNTGFGNACSAPFNTSNLLTDWRVGMNNFSVNFDGTGNVNIGDLQGCVSGSSSPARLWVRNTFGPPNPNTGFRIDNNNLPNTYAAELMGNVFIAGGGTSPGPGLIFSDKDLKENVNSIKSSLDLISKLTPVSYNLKASTLPQLDVDVTTTYGLIAQEVEMVIPELVKNVVVPASYDGTGAVTNPSITVKALNYTGLIPFAIRGIQELNSKQQAMQATLDKSGLSDAQVKTNVNTFNALATVKTLSPVKYNFTNANVPQLNFKPNTDYGFIAQQLETVYPELVDTIRIDATYDSLGVVVNPSKLLKTVNYKAMSALLVRSIQEQQLTIDSLRNAHSKQDSINNAVQQQLAALASQINSCCSNTSARNANSTINQLDVELSDKDAIVLNQNVPNPFAEQTTITYNVPSSVEKAQLIFFNANGQVIQTVDIKTRGKGKVNVFASDLSSGLYHYTLVADGKVVDSKKMVRE